MRPDAIVSIHADGGPPSGRGFHVNYSSPRLNDAQAGPAVQLANIMRDSLVASGLQKSTYVGADELPSQSLDGNTHPGTIGDRMRRAATKFARAQVALCHWFNPSIAHHYLCRSEPMSRLTL
jgi:N-acetylmuramoyl-L-alanine amidase